MNRRDLIRNLIAGTGAICLQSPFVKLYAEANRGALPDVHAMLTEITETLIPETDTPGARTLNLADACIRMIDDCYDEKSQKLFIAGIARTNEVALADFGKGFDKCSQNQRETVLRKMAATQGQPEAFYNMVRGLTIRTYNNTEYVMTKIHHYVMAPGFYHGCVPLNPTK